MRDADTQIYQFVIRDPPHPVAPDPETWTVKTREGAQGGALELPELPVAVRPGKPTPARFATPRRPLPPAKKRPVARGEGLLIAAGLLLGIGVGGGIDGSMFDQLLLYHVEPGAEVVAVKTLPMWDGLLHAGAWLMTLLGLGLLWQVTRRADVPRRTPTFVGALLLGWGFFNGVEGALDHQLLRVHQAHPGPAQLLWDSGLIVSGVVLMLVGGLCLGFARRRDGAQ